MPLETASLMLTLVSHHFCSSGFFKGYTSAAKLTFERVVKGGCKCADAGDIYKHIQEKIRARQNKEAYDDIVQTCRAFREHFDYAAAADEFVANFPFCLHFFAVT